MPSTFLTPVGAKVKAEVHGGVRRIFFPDINEWEEHDASIARKRGEDAPWPPDMSAQISRWQAGETVILNPNGQIRLGVSAALMVHWKGYFVPILGRFDATHPTRGQRLTTFAGVLESRDILAELYGELVEEAIITMTIFTADHKHVIRHDVGQWSFDGTIRQKSWVVDYADAHRGYDFNPTLLIPVEPLEMSVLTDFHFGEQVITGLPAFEPDTGSVELIKLFQTELPDDAVIVDGEKLPNGDYRESPPIAMFLTDKAFQFLNLLVWVNNIANWTGT